MKFFTIATALFGTVLAAPAQHPVQHTHAHKNVQITRFKLVKSHDNVQSVSFKLFYGDNTVEDCPKDGTTVPTFSKDAVECTGLTTFNLSGDISHPVLNIWRRSGRALGPMMGVAVSVPMDQCRLLRGESGAVTICEHDNPIHATLW